MPSSEERLLLLQSNIEKLAAELRNKGYSMLQPIDIWDDDSLSQQAEVIYRQAALYAASLIPKDVSHFHFMSQSGLRSPDHIERKKLLINRLDILRPLMEIAGGIELNLGVDNADFSATDALIREIRKLLVGEESELFQPVYRKSGQRQKAYTEAENKFRALTHEKRLRASGKTPGEAQSLVCNAFGAPWSTIAGWRKQCEKSLGSIFVSTELERANRQKLPPEKLEKLISRNLVVDGEAYKRKVRPFETEMFRQHIRKMTNIRES